MPNNPEIWVHRSEEISPGIALLYLTTRWNEATCMDTVESACEYLAKGTKQFIIDLSGIHTSAVFGIGQLTRIKKEAMAKGGSVVLCNVPGFLDETLSLLGFMQFFRSFASVQEALEFILSE